jgi:hypothetical protein
MSRYRYGGAASAAGRSRRRAHSDRRPARGGAVSTTARRGAGGHGLRARGAARGRRRRAIGDGGAAAARACARPVSTPAPPCGRTRTSSTPRGEHHTSAWGRGHGLCAARREGGGVARSETAAAARACDPAWRGFFVFDAAAASCCSIPSSWACDVQHGARHGTPAGAGGGGGVGGGGGAGKGGGERAREGRGAGRRSERAARERAPSRPSRAARGGRGPRAAGCPRTARFGSQWFVLSINLLGLWPRARSRARPSGLLFLLVCWAFARDGRLPTDGSLRIPVGCVVYKPTGTLAASEVTCASQRAPLPTSLLGFGPRRDGRLGSQRAPLPTSLLGLCSRRTAEIPVVCVFYKPTGTLAVWSRARPNGLLFLLVCWAFARDGRLRSQRCVVSINPLGSSQALVTCHGHVHSNRHTSQRSLIPTSLLGLCSRRTVEIPVVCVFYKPTGTLAVWSRAMVTCTPTGTRPSGPPFLLVCWAFARDGRLRSQ